VFGRIERDADNEAIAATLRAEPDPQAACSKLVAQANDAGGRDNITVLIVRFDTTDPQSNPRLRKVRA
jgi:serine/threonine protein phosphatase PrpC